MLQHIALEIKEKDLRDFYIGILGGKIENKSTLKREDVTNVFEVYKQAPVYNLQLQDIKFELFVHETIEQDSLQHFCINLKNASRIYEKANVKKYRTYLKKRGDIETYFISDDNGNMFEVKNGKNHPENHLG